MNLLNSNFFTFSYWFSLVPGSLDSATQTFLSFFFTFVLIVWVVGKMLAAEKSSTDKLLARVYRKIGTLGVTMGILGFVILFFFYQNVYLLNARFWFLLWILILAFWIWKIVHLHRVKIPKIKENLREQQEYEKYLPQKKV
ncbi:MAG TPA: hypothetical protein VJA22_01285 [Patescibacteria group bacterium]|nr:hypothetical protein [Patescibacteria group bacterium]